MVKRPLKDKRPIGPFLQDDESDSQPETDSISEEEINEGSEDAIVEQAEKWYRSVTDEGKKRKMMVAYINGITDDSISRQDAEEIVDGSEL